MVRLAWHDSGTYDASIGTSKWPRCGGANGSIRFSPEINHGANAGLSKALGLLEEIKQKYPTVSWADLMQMASATGVEVVGGPKIDMIYGRVDVATPEECAPEGNLPAAMNPFPHGDNARDHLRRVFHRMGFNDREIVALSGAHTIGRAHKDRSGLGAECTKFTAPSACPRHDGASGIGSTVGGSSWTEKWLKFDNSYFTTLMDPNADPELLKLDTDKVLVEDEAFAPVAAEYAASEEAFFRDYAAVHKKLSELGSKFEPAEGIRID